MSNIVSVEQTGLKSTYASDFDSLLQCLSSFPEGLRYLNGNDADGHISVALKLQEIFAQLEFSHEEVIRLNHVFNFVKFYHFEAGNFKTDPGQTFLVKPEKNLLARFSDKPEISCTQELLSKILKVSHESISQSSQSTQIGYLIWLLIIENGVLTTRHLVSALKALGDSETSIHKIEGLYFIDLAVQLKPDEPIYIKRVLLGPITLVFLSKLEVLSVLREFGLDRFNQKKVLELRANFITQHLELALSNVQITTVVDWFGVVYLPGFLYSIAKGHFQSYNLSLKDFGRLHGVNPHIDAIAEDFDDVDIEKTALKRRVNVRYFTEKDLSSFYEFLSIHPSVSQVEAEHYRRVTSLCYFLGLRRAEALYIRHCDILPVETRSFPGTLHIREYEDRTLKNVTSERHVSISLLPKSVAEFVVRNASNKSEKLLIGRAFDEMSEIYFFDRLNKLLRQFLGPGFVMHSCRHSYVSLGIIRSMFAQLNLEQIASCSSFINTVAPTAQKYLRSQRLSETTSKHLITLSQAAGHATISTTLRNYLHSSDLLIYGALCRHRPFGYREALSAAIGVSTRTIQRWDDKKDLYKNANAEAAHGLSIVKVHAQKLIRVADDTKLAYELFRDNYDEELSVRELNEWVRLYAIFSKSQPDLISFIDARLDDRACIFINENIEFLQFKQLMKSNHIGISLWEYCSTKASCRIFIPYDDKKINVFPCLIRLSSTANDISAGNYPRRILKILISTLKAYKS